MRNAAIVSPIGYRDVRNTRERAFSVIYGLRGDPVQLLEPGPFVPLRPGRLLRIIARMRKTSEQKLLEYAVSQLDRAMVLSRLRVDDGLFDLVLGGKALLPPRASLALADLVLELARQPSAPRRLGS